MPGRQKGPGSPKQHQGFVRAQWGMCSDAPSGKVPARPQPLPPRPLPCEVCDRCPCEKCSTEWLEGMLRRRGALERPLSGHSRARASWRWLACRHLGPCTRFVSSGATVVPPHGATGIYACPSSCPRPRQSPRTQPGVLEPHRPSGRIQNRNAFTIVGLRCLPPFLFYTCHAPTFLFPPPDSAPAKQRPRNKSGSTG